MCLGEGGTGPAGSPCTAGAAPMLGRVPGAHCCLEDEGGSLEMSGGSLALHLTRPKFQDGRDQPPKGPGELRGGQSGGCAAGQELPVSQEPQSPYLQYSFLNSLSKSMFLAGRGL